MASNSITEIIRRSTGGISSNSSFEPAHSSYISAHANREAVALAKKFNLPETRNNQSEDFIMQVTAFHEAGHWTAAIEEGAIPTHYHIGTAPYFGGSVGGAMPRTREGRLSTSMAGPVVESAVTTKQFGFSKGMAGDAIHAFSELHPELAERSEQLYSQWRKQNPGQEELGISPPTFLVDMMQKAHFQELNDLGSRLTNELLANTPKMEAINKVAEAMYNNPVSFSPRATNMEVRSVSNEIGLTNAPSRMPFAESMIEGSLEYLKAVNAPEFPMKMAEKFLGTLPEINLNWSLPLQQSHLSASNLTPLGILNQLTGAVPFAQKSDWSSQFGQGINTLARTGGLNNVANALVPGQSFAEGRNSQTQVGNFTIGARPELLSTQQGGQSTAWNIMFSSAGGKTGSAAFRSLSPEEQQRARLAGEAQRQASGADFSGALMFDKDAFQQALVQQGYAGDAREAKKWMANIGGQNPNDVAQIMRSQGVFSGATYFPADPNSLNAAVNNADTINQAVQQGLAVASPNDPSGIVQQMGINADMGNPVASQAMSLLGINPQSAATGGLYNPAVRQQLAGSSQARLAYLNSTYGNAGGMGQPPVGSSSGNPPAPNGPLPPSGPNGFGRRIEANIERGNLNYNPERISGIIDNLSEKFEKLSKTTEGVTTSQAESIQKIAQTWSQVSGPISDLQKAAAGGSTVAGNILNQIGQGRISGLGDIGSGLMDTSGGTSLMQAGFAGGMARDWSQTSMLGRIGSLMQRGGVGKTALSEMESQGLLQGAGGAAMRGAAALGSGLEGLVQMHYAYRNIGRMFIDPVEQAAQQYSQMQVQNYQGMAQYAGMGSAGFFGGATPGFDYQRNIPTAALRNQLTLGAASQSAYGGIIASPLGTLAAQAQANLAPGIGAGLATEFALRAFGPEVSVPAAIGVGAGTIGLGVLGNITSFGQDQQRQVALTSALQQSGTNPLQRARAAINTDVWGSVNMAFGAIGDVLNGTQGARELAMRASNQQGLNILSGTYQGQIGPQALSNAQIQSWQGIAEQYGGNPQTLDPTFSKAFSFAYGIGGQGQQLGRRAEQVYQGLLMGGDVGQYAQQLTGLAAATGQGMMTPQGQAIVGASANFFNNLGSQGQINQLALSSTFAPSQQLAMGIGQQFGMTPDRLMSLGNRASADSRFFNQLQQAAGGVNAQLSLAPSYQAFSGRREMQVTDQGIIAGGNESWTGYLNSQLGTPTYGASLGRTGDFAEAYKFAKSAGKTNDEANQYAMQVAGQGIWQSGQMRREAGQQLSQFGFAAGGTDIFNAVKAREVGIDTIGINASVAPYFQGAMQGMATSNINRAISVGDLRGATIMGQQLGVTNQMIAGYAKYGGATQSNYDISQQAAMLDPNSFAQFGALAGGNQIAWSQATDALGGPQWRRQVQTGSQFGTVGMQAGYDEVISSAQSQRLLSRGVTQGYIRGDGRYSLDQLGSMNEVQRQQASRGLQIEERNYGFALENRQMARQIASVGVERGFEDTGIALSREKQDWSRYVQGQQIGLQGQQMQYNYQFQGQQLQIGRQHEIVQQQWQEQNLAYQRNVNELQYGFSQIDSAEEVRYSTGRQRRTAMRHQEQATVMFSLQEGQQTKEEERQKTREKWSEDQFNRDKSHFEQTHQFELRNFELTRENFQKEGDFIRQERTLEDQERTYRRHIQDLDLQDARDRLAFEQNIKKTMDDLNGATTVWNTQATEAASKLSYMATTGQLLAPALDAVNSKLQALYITASNFSSPTTPDIPNSSQPSSGQPFDLGGYTGLPEFASGGYTGLARKNQAMGIIVHGGEWVVPQHGSLVAHNPEMMQLLSKIHTELQAIHADGGNAIIQIHTNNPGRAMSEGKSLYERAYSQ